MNRSETVVLCRTIAGLCPAQHFDKMTPDAWWIVLDDVDATDAMAAVRTLYREFGNDEEYGSRKIEADDILRQVKRIRADRIKHTDPEALIPPPGLSVVEWVAWHRDALQRAGDGEQLKALERGIVTARTIKPLGRRIEDDTEGTAA